MEEKWSNGKGADQCSLALKEGAESRLLPEQVLELSHISSSRSWPCKLLDLTSCQYSLWVLLETECALCIRRVHLSHRLSRTGLTEIACMRQSVGCTSCACAVNLKIKTKRLYNYFSSPGNISQKSLIFNFYCFTVQFLWCCDPAIHALLFCTNIPTLLISHLGKYEIVKISQFQIAKCKCICGEENCWTVFI